MLKFAALLTIVLLAASAGRGVAAQTPDDVIVIPRGQERAVPFKNLIGAAVGDVNVAHIQGRVTPTEVVLFAQGIGETALELTQRCGQRKRLIVRVLSARPSEARTPSMHAAEVPGAMKAAPLNPITKTRAPGRGEAVIRDISPPGARADEAAVRPDAPQKVVTHPAGAPGRQREKPRAQTSALSRLEIWAETFFLFDREDVRMVSTELMDPQKLRAAVSADVGERMSANSQREQVMTVRRSSVVTPLTLKYDISTRDSLTVVVPYVSRRDEIKVGGDVITTRGRGLGDVQVRFSRAYQRLFKSAWDSTLEGSVGLPTGKSIYNSGRNQSPVGIGHYEVGGLFSARRTFDPLTFNAAVGVNYALPRTVQGTRITPGLGYSAQTGFGYALTDKWALTEQLDYTRRPNVFLVSPTDAETVNTGQSYLSHGLMYNTDGGHTFRMMFNLGLNPASSDYGIGFTYSYRRKGQTPQ